MSTIPDDPDRIPNDTAAAMDRHAETMSILARSRRNQGRTLSEHLADHLQKEHSK